MPKQLKGPRVTWIGPGTSRQGGWRVRWVDKDRKSHDHGLPDEALARKWAAEKSLELSGSPCVQERTVQPVPYESSVASGPKTPEDIVRLIDETIDGVRDGRIDPRRAPAIVQLAKARQSMVASMPKDDDVGNYATMSHSDLMRKITEDLRTLCTADELWQIAAGLTEGEEEHGQ